MALTRSEVDRKLDEHFSIEFRDHVEGVLATLTDDVEHDMVSWPTGPSRDGACRFYETFFADLSGGKVAPRHRLRGDNFMVRVSMWRGRALAYRLVQVIEFADNRDSRRENVWVDLGAILQQLPPRES